MYIVTKLPDLATLQNHYLDEYDIIYLNQDIDYLYLDLMDRMQAIAPIPANRVYFYYNGIGKGSVPFQLTGFRGFEVTQNFNKEQLLIPVFYVNFYPEWEFQLSYLPNGAKNRSVYDPFEVSRKL